MNNQQKPEISYNPAEPTWPFNTGIEGLDKALGNILTPGNLIGVIGCSGSGKTVLATQIARNAIKAAPPFPTLYVSTEVDPVELRHRLISSEFDVPYEEFKNYTSDYILWKNGKVENLNSTKYEIERLIEYVAFEQKFRQMKFIDSSDQHRHNNFDEVTLTEIDQFEENLPDSGGVIILDYLDEPICDFPREIMEERMAKLRAISDRGKALMIVLTQAQQNAAGKRILTPNDTSVSPLLLKNADAFIGIGHAMGDDEKSGAMFRKSQNLNVIHQKDRITTIRVPVLNRFEFQRIEDREDVTISAGGYVPYSRDRYQEICAIGYPPCINLYNFLLAKSRYKGARTGQSWYALETISSATGLTHKQVRTAKEKLSEAGIISVKRRNNSSLLYKISDWMINHSADGAQESENGYIRVYRSLQNEENKFFHDDPEILQLWLYLLMNARVLQSSKEWEEHRGCLVVDYLDIEHEIGMRKSRCQELLGKLEANGSIELREGTRGQTMVKICNWDKYQVDV